MEKQRVLVGCNEEEKMGRLCCAITIATKELSEYFLQHVSLGSIFVPPAKPTFGTPSLINTEELLLRPQDSHGFCVEPVAYRSILFSLETSDGGPTSTKSTPDMRNPLLEACSF